jgi:predicted dinucleotide-binding enzyme
LEKLARDAGRNAQAGTPEEAARDADAILLAVHWSRMNDVLKQAGNLSGKVIVSCAIPMNAGDTKLVIAHTSSGAEALSKKVRKAAVVSAFSTVPSEVLFDVFLNCVPFGVLAIIGFKQAARYMFQWSIVRLSVSASAR